MLVKNVGDQEFGPKWTVQKGESGRFLKWTLQDDDGRSFEPKLTAMG